MQSDDLLLEQSAQLVKSIPHRKRYKVCEISSTYLSPPKLHHVASKSGVIH
ncbi:hypothetical protein Sjap_026021 [Stephania japonica]|uniref:Uncharacterized protein n=1 Tax=Stephania japonica TaxID=461633 RepID=A0AAP0E5B7_9MAGN